MRAAHVSGLSDQDVSERIGLAAGTINSVKKSIWRCRYLCRTKLRVFKALMLSVLLYGSEIWTLSSTLVSRLYAFRNKSLRRFMVYSWQDHVSNRLHREIGKGPVTSIIRDPQLRLCGHLARFPVYGPTQQVVFLRENPTWGRSVGRLRKSWAWAARPDLT
ncbi:uncharacterized protein [Penaeus vannamei]|uniref:uncharacterized protein n=1 Tax=Penaeus vannamei TaxID=6689 RepID=UPI00387F732D